MSQPTQGKCPACRVAFRWTKRIKLREASCPRCATALVATSYLFKGPWVEETPAERPPAS